jgi:flagellar hook protein FlgE
MQVNPAINSAVWGMNDAGRRFDTAAENVATGTGDLGTELVEGTIVAPAAYAANAAVFRTADETRGYLLDVFAR